MLTLYIYIYTYITTYTHAYLFRRCVRLHLHTKGPLSVQQHERCSSFDVTSVSKIDTICLCKGFLQYFKNSNVRIPVPGYLYI